VVTLPLETRQYGQRQEVFSMARIDEIAPDLYRVSVYLAQIDLQFNHFPDQRRRAAAVP